MMTEATVEFKCPHCDAPLKAGINMAGSIGKCPQCQKGMTVPKESGGVAQEAESQK
jgi:hypothetical protein